MIVEYGSFEDEKKSLIQSAQTNLWKCNFWKDLFFDVLKRHSYQEEFYLVGENPIKDIVDVYLYNFLKKLKSRYDIFCRRETRKNAIRLYLSFTKAALRSKMFKHYFYDEISIEITREDIYLNFLPYRGYEKVFSILDYIIVQNIIEDYCREIFVHPNESYIEFLDFCKRIQRTIDKQTYKTMEIARSSIESIYSNSAEEPKEIRHDFFCSIMKIGGKDTVILYQDFLDDPQILIKKLQKK